MPSKVAARRGLLLLGGATGGIVTWRLEAEQQGGKFPL
jgi:hypothetical protein